MKSLKYISSVICLVLIASASFSQQIDLSKFEAFTPRNIGPAGMSGRVTSIDVITEQPDVIYAGTASGGLWKSTSGGTMWQPIFEDQKAASIGAVAIDQRNPDVIWVGTGEGNPRNSVTGGYGIYKSLDAGRSWTYMGLGDTRNIHRIIIDKNNPDVVYAGAIGSSWGDHPQRGVYKTTDGGKTWNKILYVNERTGVADMVVDPQNPNKLMVAMWEHRRWPWFFKSGGPGSGLYITHDGGANWNMVTDKDGFPEGELGRMGLAIAPSNPDRVYAYVESKSNAIYRSEDGGVSWKKVSKPKDNSIGNRPFYYADLYVDPVNENRVYSLFTYVNVSEDGGKSFQRFVDPGYIHVDNHAYYIHPENPDYIILGNDGGLEVSRDRGETWNYSENLPLGQFYHISVDMDVPYGIYGGLQDNGSWRGPSEVWRQGGIRNMFWERIGWGDGFDVVPDPKNLRYGYSNSQGGNLIRYDRKTGALAVVRPFHPDGLPLRFNWNIGIALDPHDQETLYVGSQYLMKSTDKAASWEIISPDLTTNDPEKQKQVNTGGLNLDNTGAENHTTIVSIAPSPVTKGVIWVGTDDGNVQLTRDGGSSWTNTVTNIKGVPAHAWVTQITASTYSDAEAFVVFDDHRRDNWEPYIFHTKDYGRTWKRLVDSNKVWGYALSFAQDPVEPKLMFAGTEFGLYVSLDAGNNWTKWTNGYPTVSTMDMVIHPRDHDLVIGTFGRSVWVLDDIRPLRHLATNGYDETTTSDLTLFTIPDAYIKAIGQNIGYRSTGHAFYVGENKPWGAAISFFVNDAEDKEARIQIVEQGDTVRTLYRKVTDGFNRIYWNFEKDGVRRPGMPEPKAGKQKPGGRSVLPGVYDVIVTYGESTQSGRINVKLDPRVELTQQEMARKANHIDEVGKMVETVAKMVGRIDEATKTVSSLQKLAKDNELETLDSLMKRSESMKSSLRKLRESIMGPQDVQGIYRDRELVWTKVSGAYSISSGMLSPVSTNQLNATNDARRALDAKIGEVNDFFSEEWGQYRSFAESLDLSLFKDF